MGRLTRARVDASVSRVLAAKQKLGLYRTRFVSLDALPDSLAQDTAAHLAQDVAQRALTLLKDDKHLFPLPAGPNNCLVVLRSDMFSQRGDTLVHELRRARSDLAVYSADTNTPESVLNATVTAVQSCQNVYVATFVTVAAFKGTIALDVPLSKFLNSLTTSNVPMALVAFGSPYVLRDYAKASTLMATFSTTDTSEVAVARALTGESPVIGRLPVSIPGVAALGAGLDVPSRSAAASTVSQ
jgi:beta-N-acetylhexosaminidase